MPLSFIYFSSGTHLRDQIDKMCIYLCDRHTNIDHIHLFPFQQETVHKVIVKSQINKPTKKNEHMKQGAHFNKPTVQNQITQ